ncbi:DUF4169 family protein [Pseudochrobactrum kiredjianiae]|uniref:DUF4169 family protein n=1 Tax=Pseudochrobactrum kiredjianiae TaxID=386305 RepID=A0ABW3V5W1_9HYPH|nr:DUF4169 family protein [Pseudochrobactrum kiredjianiae]MDM7851126.1 DUF4169 family protein [Pseudochrobactrum kiredjianiae]
MSDIINLKQFKKRKARASKEVEASANRVLFGRTKAEKSFDKTQSEKDERFLEQNKLEPRNTGSSEAETE